ncbi:hypothetical protein SAMN05428976_104139 [Clostridium sp. USBA 49]|uniref:hypothetical protein n=1 Tax=Clostridium TaxID=1485 RepID=UPI00099AA4C7|nr:MULTISPECIES: hypothetical protein [Clostridium]SKA80974.1 hypothetical protein SAMN05428976_104139 [Clostridium sp. USBA 49]
MKKSILKKHSLIFFICGIIIFVVTVVSIIKDYYNAKNAQSLLNPLLYKFFPFVISFILIKFGMKELLNKK